MKRSVRAATRVLGLGVLALALAGCIKLDMDLKVASDDTVDGTVIFAMNKDILELTGQPADALLEDAGGLPTDVEGVSAEPYEDDQFAGTQLAFDSVPLEEFNSQSDADSLSIVREGDEFRVSGVLDMSGTTGDTGAEGQPFEDVANQALSSAEIRIAITFPGEVVSANGDVSGRTVVWEPAFGERIEIEAVGSAIESGGGLPWLPIGIAGILVVAVAAGAVVLSRRSRGGRPAAATIGDEGTPSAEEPPVVEAPTEGAAMPEPPPPEASPPATPGAGSPPAEEAPPSGEPPERLEDS